MTTRLALIGLAFALALPATAQEVLPADPAAVPPAGPEVQAPVGAVQRPAPPPPPARKFDPMPVALLQGLDKVTARTSTFEAKVGEPVSFGQLTILVKACQKASPIDPPESAAFLDAQEKRADGTMAPVFQGWMFASSPALSAMEHPVYDVWVKDCRKSDSKVRSSSRP
ncbi:DUF2155 domain-containing protein [Niveispirillum sp.]|uniref:DUF2155 domain-containing protein n=1 Tax=Niveispirillum sp. TaxID=1917217 RepID=UPI0025EE93F5|nr:DUF2155 domain-containing protein [Niveispirillum sp.]